MVTLHTVFVRITAVVAVIAAVTLAPPATAVPPPCAGELDAEPGVGPGDLAVLLGSWGPCPGCDADLNGDGEVDAADLAVLLGNWGPCIFDYGEPLEDPEAEQIGLEMLGPGGPLLVPDDIYNRIDRDLDLIRAFEPALEPETHSPAWLPNHLIVKVLHDMPLEEYQALNAYYQVIDEQFLFSSGGGDWYVLTLAGNSNIPHLATIYMALDVIEFAEPDGIFGGQNFWTPTPKGPAGGAGGTWRWSIDDGFHDCFDGCDCHRLYVIDVTEAGDVSLISYQEVGQPWCEF